MNNHVFACCWVVIIPLLGFHTSGIPHEAQLYEGNQCQTENEMPGICKKLPDCRSRLEEVLQGRRGPDARGRCGFDGFTEIVCCPLEVRGKVNIRPADLACQELENEVESETSIIDDNETTTRSDKKESVNRYILAGTAAIKGEFPYMAALGYENTDGEVDDPIVYDCGGALISSRYILTAAHCVSNVNNLIPKWAKVGSVDVRSSEGIKLALDLIIPHPRYRRSQNYNDIALVSLQTPLRSSSLVRPVCLQTRPLVQSRINTNTSFMVIGFGGTETDERSETLMKSANLELVPTTICNDSYTPSSKLPHGIDETLICAVDSNSTRRSDACQGDSGAPLLMISDDGHSVIGVTSFGQGCGSSVPGGYTSVEAYIDWIESKVWPEKIKS